MARQTAHNHRKTYIDTFATLHLEKFATTILIMRQDHDSVVTASKNVFAIKAIALVKRALVHQVHRVDLGTESTARETIQPNLADMSQNLGGCCLFVQDNAKRPIGMDVHVKARRQSKDTSLGNP